MRNHTTHARLRTWLTIGYALFIVYASLSPFTGWRNHGIEFIEVLNAQLSLSYTAFDSAANILSYLPLGFLITLTLRARFGAIPSAIFALTSGILLSMSMEYMQMYLPSRISSNTDLISNSFGTLIGALLAVGVASQTWLYSRLTGWRSNFFREGKEVDFGLALLALWVFGQINPSLPILGNVFLSKIVQQPFVTLPPSTFDWWECVAVSLNLLMLGALLLSILRIPKNAATSLLVVISVVAMAKFIAAAVLLRSWALLLWINSEAVVGILIGTILLLAILGFSRIAVLIFGAVIASLYIVVVNLVLDSNAPSAAASVYHWHYGHLLNYNGLAQTISLGFPLLLILHLWRIRKV
ncbi:MAG: VanZ family protein [Gallionella sp.]